MLTQIIIILVLGLYAIVFILSLIANWKIFTKAGRHGWYSIIPLFNLYVLLKIAGKPGWWLVLLFIPLVNIVITLFFAIALAKAFGRSEAFGVLLLWLFSIIGFWIIGLGKSRYVFGPSSSDTPPAPGPAVVPAPAPADTPPGNPTV